MKRSRINPVSGKRRAQLALRREVVIVVFERAGGRCWYAPFIPEVACQHIDRTRPMLEVDELRGGSYRITEWLDPDQCRLPCQSHHRFKTEHKLEVLDRLARYEESHPWPNEPTLPNS